MTFFEKASVNLQASPNQNTIALIFLNTGNTNWNEFQDAAVKIFNVWMGGTELNWAEQVWERLADAGLTQFDSELERTQVCIRLMALGAIYLDFCYHAWEQNDYPLFCEWGDALGIQRFQVGRLVEAEHSDEFEDLPVGADEFEFLEQAYLIITDAERITIHQALCPHPETNNARLYSALYQTKNGPLEEDDQEEWDLSGSNCTAFMFVSDAFPREREY